MLAPVCAPAQFADWVTQFANCAILEPSLQTVRGKNPVCRLCVVCKRDEPSLQTGFIQFANWLRDNTWLQFANGNPAETNATLSTATMAADQTTAEQKRLFTEAMVKKISKQGDERSQFLTEARYEDICAALDGWTE